MSCLGCNAPPYLHTPRCQQELTFAEAMAMDPSEVETNVENDTWKPVDEVQRFVSCYALRRSKFRRAKPKRSRVQEMAEAKWPWSGRLEWCKPGSLEVVTFKADLEARQDAIRAVCEWLRTYEAAHVVAHDLAGAVEREFLVPR